MASPTPKRERDNARQAILHAAEEIFARNGFSGARIDAIAERSGYNKSLIFHHFTDKLGLYREVIICAKGDMEEEIGSIVKDAETSEDEVLTQAKVTSFFRRMVGHSFDKLVSHPQMRQIMMWEAAEGWNTYTAVPSFYEEFRLRARMIVNFTRKAQAAGFVRPRIDPTTIVANVIGMSLMYLSSLPRFSAVFPEADFTSDAAISHAREQFMLFVLHATLTYNPEENSDETRI